MAGEIQIDLRNYKPRFGAYVEPGTYTVQIEDAEYGKSSQKGTPQIELHMRVIGGEYDGQVLIDFVYITDKALFRVVELLTALGIPTPKTRFNLPPSRLVGKVLDILCIDEEPDPTRPQARKRTRINGYFKATKRAATANDSDLDGLDEFAGLTEAPAHPHGQLSDRVEDLPDFGADEDLPVADEPAPSALAAAAAPEVEEATEDEPSELEAALASRGAEPAEEDEFDLDGMDL